jgi:hypothetical protein
MRAAAEAGEISNTARRRGHDQLLQEFTISQVVHGYGDACQSVTDRVDQEPISQRTPASKSLDPRNLANAAQQVHDEDDQQDGTQADASSSARTPPRMPVIPSAAPKDQQQDDDQNQHGRSL